MGSRPSNIHIRIAIRIGRVLDVVKRLEKHLSLYGQKILLMRMEDKVRMRNTKKSWEDMKMMMMREIKKNTPHEDGGQGKDEEHEEELGRDEDDDDEGDEEESGTEDVEDRDEFFKEP
ncbi:hypothetical protein TEA_019262 [Camellia sinensis var. sinensis]|uniref:Uncharacterized protein n=1 Tax=Camellia sinensis var. sinensis TaxID=542762 RepID=A0A4S4DV29_CAMSN|nr:hypothetical protein TEA_019262 [Camellia sinensis var. sinensis]